MLFQCVALIACIVLLVQVIKTDVNACQKFVWQAAYSFYIIAIIYNIAILIINLGLIWAVLQVTHIFMLILIYTEDIVRKFEVWILKTVVKDSSLMLQFF